MKRYTKFKPNLRCFDVSTSIKEFEHHLNDAMKLVKITGKNSSTGNDGVVSRVLPLLESDWKL